MTCRAPGAEAGSLVGLDRKIGRNRSPGPARIEYQWRRHDLSRLASSIALGMGIVGLMAFLWSMRSGQSEDLDGAAERVLLADAADGPLHQTARTPTRQSRILSSRGKPRWTSSERPTWEQAMTEPADDRSFDWVVALALFSGAAV